MIRCENCDERFYSPEEHHSLSSCQAKTIKGLRAENAALRMALADVIDAHTPDDVLATAQALLARQAAR